MQTVKWLVIGALFFFVFSLIFTRSNDFDQDLGRHIKLGEIILQTGKIPETNLFSYTNQDFPFFNHHWFSEVIFYLAVKFLTVGSLFYLKVVTILAAVFIIFLSASNKSHSYLAACFAIFIVAPLFLERSDIRPEIFGYLFFSYFLLLLFSTVRNRNMLIATIPIMIFWVNIHITFIFGEFIVLLMLADIAICIFKKKGEIKKYQTPLIILSATILAALINPHGIYGMLYPFNIFKNYGYMIVENQSVFFLNSIIFNPTIRWLNLITPVIVVSLVILLWKKKFKELLVMAIFFGAALSQIRHTPFFILAAVVPLAVAVKLAIPKKLQTKQNLLLFSIISVCILLTTAIFFVTDGYARTFDKSSTFGVDINENGRDAANFLLQNNLPGNIFNNFDIGGYADYKLYPKYQVFVDNRPEAYPANFFNDVYIPLQQNPEFRKKIFDQYSINTVFFAHTDQTPWSNDFLASMAEDKEWRLVFLDKTMLIFTRATTLADVRNNDPYLKEKIKNAQYYLDKFKIYRALNIFGKQDLAQSVYGEARKDNPGSCALNRAIYEKYKNNPANEEATNIPRNYWYCF